ncbi:hypothetical protein GCM10023116_33250 [Kistimonas scapharcae]|uniref:Type II/III secretion system secretin-like domain-containing protein n=1 Tax=Kistimonas scapharcae TaxID=1036133 RepID=A0ABP8V576_9GAMM
MNRMMIALLAILLQSGCATTRPGSDDYQAGREALQELKASLSGQWQPTRADLEQIHGEFHCNNTTADQDLLTDKTVNLEIEEGDLRELLVEVSAQTETSIIMDDYVEGLVSIQLDDTPLATALDSLLSVGDYDYRVYDDYIFVGIREPGAPSFSRLSETCVFRPVFITPEEIITMLPPLYRQYVQPNINKGTLTIVAPRSIQSRLKDDLFLFDRAPDQVVLELTVIEVAKDALDILGIDWHGAKDFAAAASKQYLVDASFFNESVQLPAFKVPQFIDAISLLSRSGEAQIKTMPSIVTLDGHEAAFNSMQTLYGLPQMKQTNGKQQELSYGVQLIITPHVSSNNVIQMNIKNASVSDLVHDKDMPRLVGHSITSSVYVGNGNALIIGGLLQKKTHSKDSGVSGAADLPIVGDLFKQSTDRTYETEILIMIRPRLLNG